jgi:hypothetical protein
MLLRSWWSRVLLAPEGEAGAGGNEQPPKGRANAAAVDQIQNHEERLGRLEGGFFDRIATALKPREQTPPKEGETTTTQAAPKKSVLDELGECMDPFGFFEEPRPVRQPEAPVADDA